jgi:hypothetical protein
LEPEKGAGLLETQFQESPPLPLPLAPAGSASSDHTVIPIGNVALVVVVEVVPEFVVVEFVVPDVLVPEVVPPLEAVVVLLTLIVIAVALAMLPAASRATAERVCAPFASVVESKLVLKGEEVASLPRFAPSSLNCTPATPMLSLALADTVTLAPETLAFAAGAAMETLGAVESAVVVGGVVVVEPLDAPPTVQNTPCDAL